MVFRCMPKTLSHQYFLNDSHSHLFFCSDPGFTGHTFLCLQTALFFWIHRIPALFFASFAPKISLNATKNAIYLKKGRQ